MSLVGPGERADDLPLAFFDVPETVAVTDLSDGQVFADLDPVA